MVEEQETQTPVSEQEPQKTVVTGSFGRRPGKKEWALVTVVFVALVVAGVLFTNSFSSDKNTPTNPKTAAIAAPTEILITSAGLVPQTVQIHTGQSVLWKNQDSQAHQIATDPYPQENGLDGFVDTVALLKNDTYSFTFDKSGTFTYHDHLSPSKLHGTVIVTDAK
jgi:plastocyanin